MQAGNRRQRPTSKAERERVETVCFELTDSFLYQLECSRNPERDLLVVMDALAREVALGSYLPEKEWLNRLRAAMIYMRGGVDREFTLSADFDVRWQGLEALYAQALYWGASPEERANWPRDYVEVMMADAATLREALRAYVGRYSLCEEHYG